MENNEIIMANEDVAVEVVESTTKLSKGAKVAIGIGATVLVGGLVYKFVVKPIVKKVKAKKASKQEEDWEKCEETLAAHKVEDDVDED